MSISLSNHEDRIVALENQPTGSHTSQISGNKFCITFSDGLKLQGCVNQSSGSATFLQNFSNTNYVTLVTINQNNADSGSPGVYSKTVSGFGFTTTHNWYSAGWLAIGYLISNRIRSLIGGDL